MEERVCPWERNHRVFWDGDTNNKRQWIIQILVIFYPSEQSVFSSRPGTVSALFSHETSLLFLSKVQSQLWGGSRGTPVRAHMQMFVCIHARASVPTQEMHAYVLTTHVLVQTWPHGCVLNSHWISGGSEGSIIMVGLVPCGFLFSFDFGCLRTGWLCDSPASASWPSSVLVFCSEETQGLFLSFNIPQDEVQSEVQIQRRDLAKVTWLTLAKLSRRPEPWVSWTPVPK